MQMSVPARYGEPPPAAPTDQLEARLKALPGVVNVGGTTRLPLGSTQVTTMLEVEGRPVPRAELPEVEMRRAVFDYFATMQIPVLRGRAFTRDDHPTALRVADRQLRAGQPRVSRRGPDRHAAFGSAADWLTIIGVVGNIKHGSLEEVPKPELYITYRQGPPVWPVPRRLRPRTMRRR